MNGDTTNEDDLDLEIGTEDLLNYVNQCVVDPSQPPSIGDLVRKTSKVCTEQPIDEGDTGCDGKTTPKCSLENWLKRSPD